LGVLRIIYQDFGTKKRTILRLPVAVGRDAQGLPPWGWCVGCGKEVYEKGAAVCHRCRSSEELKIES